MGQVGHLKGQGVVFKDKPQVVDSKWNTGKKIRLPLEITSISVGAHRLHDADQDIGVEIVFKTVNRHLRNLCVRVFLGISVDMLLQTDYVVVEQLLSDRLGQFALGTVKERSHIVLCRTLASTLEIDVIGSVPHKHDVASLEIAVEEIVTVRRQKIVGKGTEVPFEEFLIERYSCQLEEIILEILQIPGDRLCIEAAAGVSLGKVHIASHNLDKGQIVEYLAIKSQSFGIESHPATPFVVEVAIERGIAQILLQIVAATGIYRIDLRNTHSPFVQGFCIIEEGIILAHIGIIGSDATVMVSLHTPILSVAAIGSQRQHRDTFLASPIEEKAV